MDLKEILTPERIAVSLHVSSKKRLMERVAALLLKGSAGLDRNTVFQILLDRERLGSTGVGNGVALPHGRANDLHQAIGAVATLDEPLDFDAIDGAPVQLVFALLVPAEATEGHLKLLAHLASMLSNRSLRDELLSASEPRDIYDALTRWNETP